MFRFSWFSGGYTPAFIEGNDQSHLLSSPGLGAEETDLQI